MEKIPAKKVYLAIQKGQTQKLVNWNARERLSSERLNRMRFGSKKNTVLHEAIENVRLDVFVWLLRHVSAELLDVQNNEGMSPMQMIVRRIDAISSVQTKGEDFYDSLSFAAANQRGRRLTPKERYDLQELEHMKSALEKSYKTRVGLMMLNMVSSKGSLEGVQKVTEHFPEVIPHMDHQQVMDMIEKLDSSGYQHISDYISSQL